MKFNSVILDEIFDTLKRQLSEMDYFEINASGKSEIDEDTLKYSPLVWFEGEFAEFDDRIKVSGESSSVSTHSKKNIIATNAC